MKYHIFKSIDKKRFGDQKNWIVDHSKREIYFLVNPKVYDKRVLFCVLYQMQKYGYFIVDYDEEDYLVYFKVQDNSKKYEELVQEFNNSLINYEHYFLMGEFLKDVKEQIFKEVNSQLEAINQTKAKSCDCEEGNCK